MLWFWARKQSSPFNNQPIRRQKCTCHNGVFFTCIHMLCLYVNGLKNPLFFSMQFMNKWQEAPKNMNTSAT